MTEDLFNPNKIKFKKPETSLESSTRKEASVSNKNYLIKKDVNSINDLENKIKDEIKITEIKKEMGIEKNSEKTQEFLSKLIDKNGILDFAQLKKVGHGGTHDVFVSPDNASSVIKLNRGQLNRVLAKGETSFSPEMRKAAEQHVISENLKRDQLYQYFGNANCLYERILIQKVKIESDGKSQEAEAPISIQESSNVFANPDKKDFSTSYAEKNLTEKNKDVYKKMNDALMGNGEFNENDFLQFNDKLKPIFELIGNDEGFKNSMQEFLLRFKEYFSASGNFIDLVGEENILFYPKEGKWNFQIGSVLKAESRKNVEESLKMLEENPELLETSHRKGNLMNGLALTRLLNAVGIKSGVGKVVDIQLNEKQIANLDKIIF